MNQEQTTQNEQKIAQDIEGFLQTVIERTPEVAQETRTNPLGRKPILPSLVLWSSMVVAVLRGFTSQLAVWRLLTWEGLWQYPKYQVSDQAVYDRLANGGHEGLHGLFLQIRDVLQERLQPYEQKGLAPFATGVYAMDGSTLDKIARHLPILAGNLGAVALSSALGSSGLAGSSVRDPGVARAPADTSLSSDEIPPARRQYVRDYFLRLRSPGGPR
jgi:hypothetical protein